jgi:hypothetical protein
MDGHCRPLIGRRRYTIKRGSLGPQIAEKRPCPQGQK